MIVSNIIQIKEHFQIYIPYFENISNMISQIINKHNQKKQKSDIGIVIKLKKGKKQAILNISQFLRQNQNKTSRLVAIALYRIRKSCNIFENKGQATQYHKINPILKISLAKLFKGILLDEIYRKIKIDVYTVIDICTYLNYVTNSFSNISYKKIINLFVHIQIEIFQFKLEKTLTIKYLAL